MRIVIPANPSVGSAQRSLAALRRTLSGGAAEICVLAHSPAPAVLAWWQQEPGITLYHTDGNGDVAAVYRDAINHTACEYLLFLQESAEPQAGWLDFMLAGMESDQRLAAIGARLITAKGGLVEVGQLKKLDGSLSRRGEKADSSTHSYLPAVDVDAVSGCLLVRKTIFEEVGGLAEGQWLDAAMFQDVCQRIRQAGYRVAVEPRACVVVPEIRVENRKGARGTTGSLSRNMLRIGEAAAGSAISSAVDQFQKIRAAILPQPIRVAILVPYYGPDCLWGEAMIADNLREALEWRSDVSKVQIFDYAHVAEIDEFIPDLIFSFTAWRQPLRFKHGVTLFYIVNYIHEHMPAGRFMTQDDALRMDADIYATNSPVALEFLSKYKPAQMLHMAANPRVHRPMAPTPKYRAQVTYLGAYYPGTKGPEVFDRYVLPAAEFDLAIWGLAWQTSPDVFKRHWRGELPLADIARLYSSVDIALGVNAKSQAAAGMINNRVFEILACGALLLSDRYPALEAAFGDVAVFTDGYADTREKLDYYLRHPDERNALVERARVKIEEAHTYDHRAREIINMYAEFQHSRGRL